MRTDRRNIRRAVAPRFARMQRFARSRKDCAVNADGRGRTVQVAIHSSRRILVEVALRRSGRALMVPIRSCLANVLQLSSAAPASFALPVEFAELHGKHDGNATVFRLANVLGVSCTAGPACRSRGGAAVAAEELPSHDWRTATAVTPSRWRQRRQLGCRAEAGPCQLHTKVSRWPISR